MGKKKKNCPKHARKHHCRQRGSTCAGRCPWGGHARNQKEETGEKKRSHLESLKGKVEILESLEGSNTPEGQRPGELHVGVRRLQHRRAVLTRTRLDNALALARHCRDLELWSTKLRLRNDSNGKRNAGADHDVPATRAQAGWQGDLARGMHSSCRSDNPSVVGCARYT